MSQERREQKIRLITDNTNFDYFEVITFSGTEIDDLLKNLRAEIATKFKALTASRQKGFS